MLCHTDSKQGHWRRVTLVATLLLVGALPAGVDAQARLRRSRAGSEVGFDFAGC